MFKSKKNLVVAGFIALAVVLVGVVYYMQSKTTTLETAGVKIKKVALIPKAVTNLVPIDQSSKDGGVILSWTDNNLNPNIKYDLKVYTSSVINPFNLKFYTKTTQLVSTEYYSSQAGMTYYVATINDALKTKINSFRPASSYNAGKNVYKSSNIKFPENYYTFVVKSVNKQNGQVALSNVIVFGQEP